MPFSIQSKKIAMWAHWIIQGEFITLIFAPIPIQISQLVNAYLCDPLSFLLCLEFFEVFLDILTNISRICNLGLILRGYLIPILIIEFYYYTFLKGNILYKIGLNEVKKIFYKRIIYYIQFGLQFFLLS